jgi:hypothetical protein
MPWERRPTCEGLRTRRRTVDVSHAKSRVAGAEERGAGDDHSKRRKRIHRPVLAAVEAQLSVGDITESGAYYTSKIGFSTAFTY